MDLTRIARNLESERCIKHREKPTAKPSGESITISCCCSDFKLKLTEKMRKEITRQVQDDIKRALRLK